MSRTPEPPSAFAWLTGAGPAAIAVVRVRGPRAERFLKRHVRTRLGVEDWSPGRVFRGRLLNPAGDPIDDILVSVNAAQPHLDIWLHLHGNPWLVQHTSECLAAMGIPEDSACGDVWPGTTLVAREAYALLPRMLTLRGADWLLGQVDRLTDAAESLQAGDDLAHARRTCAAIAAGSRVVAWFATPLRVALVGPPNAGKSTLLNALTDRPTSVVSAQPGTTRDWVEAAGQIDGFPVRWLDTAGLRGADDPLEAAGVALTRRIAREADATILVLDGTPAARDTTAAFVALHADPGPTCVALNKCDIAGEHGLDAGALPADWRERIVRVSALTRDGLERLTRALLVRAGRDEASLLGPAAFTQRQVAILEEAAASTDAEDFHRILEGLIGGPTPEGKSPLDRLRAPPDER